MAGTDVVTLRTLMDEGKLKINNIQELDNAPEMTAAKLKKEFDKNVANLVGAMDEFVIPTLASKSFVNEKVVATGNGDMDSSVYATNGGTGIVDKSVADANGDNIAETYATKEELLQAITGTNIRDMVLDMFFPVGSIRMSVDNNNPSSYLGGTWIAWGSGQVPVGVKASDTDFSTAEKTGGSKTVSVPNHVHSVPAATTGSTALTTAMIPSHNHSVSIYTDYQGNHQHGAAGGHSHTVSGTAASGGSHRHYISMAAYPLRDGTDTKYNYLTLSGSTSARYTNYSENHTHTVSGTAAAVSNHTHSTTGNHRHLVSGSTGNSGSGSGHTHSISARNSGSAGEASVSNLQPYITCYMWKRTA